MTTSEVIAIGATISGVWLILYFVCGVINLRSKNTKLKNVAQTVSSVSTILVLVILAFFMISAGIQGWEIFLRNN